MELKYTRAPMLDAHGSWGLLLNYNTCIVRFRVQTTCDAIKMVNSPFQKGIRLRLLGTSNYPVLCGVCTQHIAWRIRKVDG